MRHRKHMMIFFQKKQLLKSSKWFHKSYQKVTLCDTQSRCVEPRFDEKPKNNPTKYKETYLIIIMSITDRPSNNKNENVDASCEA